MRKYVDYSKSQIIEKLDLLQCEIDLFDAKKKKKPDRSNWLQVVAILNIGDKYCLDTEEYHKQYAGDMGLVKPKKSAADGSEFCQ